MGIQNDGFTKDPSTGGGASTPTGTGFVHVTNGVQDSTAQAPSASDILAALASGKYGIFPLSSVAGTANAITANSGVTLASGQFFCLIPGSTSTSTTVNLNLDSVGDKRIKGPDGSADPAVGDLISGRPTLLYYDGTSFRQILGSPGNLALSSVSGTNTITAVASAPPFAGQLLILIPANTNSGATTLNINSGGAVAIKQADGSTALAAGDLVAGKAQVLHYDGTVFRLVTGGIVSATDNTKLPTDGSGSMTGPIVHSADSSATSSNYELVRIANTYVRNAPSGKAIEDRIGGIAACKLFADFTFCIGPQANSYGYVLSYADLNTYYNVPTGGTHIFRRNGVAIGNFPLTPSDMPLANCPLLVAATTFASNGTWTNLFELSAGAYKGDFFLYTSITRGCGKYPVTGTTLAGSTDSTGAGLFVDSGFEGSVYVALRVNSGWLQIYVGTGVLASTKFGLGFQGIVV